MAITDYFGKEKRQYKRGAIWTRKAGQSPTGGLNAAGRKSAGVKAPVTESNPKGKRAKRRKSFCARMCGMKRRRTSRKTARNRKSRINLALRKWRCRC